MKYRFPLFTSLLLVLSLAASAQLQKIATLGGTGFTGFTGDGNIASDADFSGPLDVTLDKAGNLYVEDYFNNRVRKITPAGIITTVAGSGFAGHGGDNSYATSATLTPHGIAADKKGNIYIADASFGVIRKVDPLGIITTIAGGGAYGYTGDGGLAVNARLSVVYGLAVDDTGNLYIADAGNHVVRKIDTFGIINTIVGIGGTSGYLGDGGPATAALIDSPYTLAIDNIGNLFIADYGNNVIRVVDTTNTIYTSVGTVDSFGYSGDGGQGYQAIINKATGVAVDKDDNLYIADAANNRIRMVSAKTGVISTVAGNGYAGFGGDLSYAIGANLFNPTGVAVDAAGSIYIADANNERVRKTYNANVGVNKVSSATVIGATPNPFTNNITVAGLSAFDKVVLYDVTGRQVSPLWSVATDGTHSFSITNLATGMYMLQVYGSDGARKSINKMVKE